MLSANFNFQINFNAIFSFAYCAAQNKLGTIQGQCDRGNLTKVIRRIRGSFAPHRLGFSLNADPLQSRL